MVQLLYVALVGSFPFNSFLSGFFAALGTAVLTSKSTPSNTFSLFSFSVCLRIQLTSPALFHNISAERAFADWLVCMLLLHTACVNFLG